ncbi:MAG: twin-arginine translocase subunit TatC [Thermomicrobiales bacterium]|nr:twin-arginine translocase subunit TatC [Thermomicrobiales bacterium]
MATTEEERGTTTANWPLNGAADGGGPLTPSGAGVPAPDDEDYLDEPMTLQEHLRELRDRLIKCVLGVAVGMGIGFFFTEHVLNYFKYIVVKSDPNARFMVTSPTEYIAVYLKLMFYLGIAFSMPVLLYQLIRFLAPGLTRTERRYVYYMLPFVLVFFALGVVFASGVAVPNMFHFLLGISKGTADNDMRVGEVMDFFSNLSLWTGIVFEMPLVMFLLATLGIAPYAKLKSFRKYAAVGLMILAAVITPTPDPGSMLIVWAPMYLLFELGLILARFARPRRRGGVTA